MKYGSKKTPPANTRSYNLYTYFNSELLFSQLPVGNYTYFVEATDASGTTKTLRNDPFRVYKQLSNYTNGDYVVQGFAAGTTYCYSFEVNKAGGGYAADTLHRLYRYNMDTGVLNKMTLGEPGVVGPPVDPVLGHANDMALVSINGVGHMYVVASGAIVKLRYDLNGNYWFVARYPCPNSWTFGGITYMGSGTNANTIRLLVNNQYTYYTIDIGHNNPGVGQPGYIPISLNESPPNGKFTIGVTAANGVNYSSYSRQGIHYDRDNRKLYVPLWSENVSKANENVILVYNNMDIASNPPNNPKPPNNAVLVKKGNIATVKYEMEGVGFPGARPNPSENNVLWYNTNEGIYYPGSQPPVVYHNGGIHTDPQSIK